MWEIFQNDLRQCLQNLNQTLLIWQKQTPEAKTVATIINQLQKLVAGGLLLQATDLVDLIKKLQIFLEERSLDKTALNADDGDVIHSLSIFFDELAKCEDPQQAYITNKEKIIELTLVLTSHIDSNDASQAAPINNEEQATKKINTIEKQQVAVENTKSITNDFPNINIVDIFHKELQLGIHLLIECVLKIENGTARINDYKEMMRCAHSLKGGARLAGLHNVVTLTHNLEDIFTKVQNGEHHFKSDDIDILMQLIDMLFPLSSVEIEENLSPETIKLLDESECLFKKLIENKGAKIQSESNEISQDSNIPVEIIEKINSSEFSGSEEYLQKIINIVSDMKIDAQLSFEMMNEFRRLYKELSLFGHDLDEAQEKTSPDHSDRQNNFRQTMQHCSDLLEKFDLSNIESKNKVIRLSKSALSCRMGPFENSITGITRLVRDLAKKQNKLINLSILGQKTSIDRDILKELSPVLIHLVQNAVDHGISIPEQRVKENKEQQANIIISAQHRSGYLIINVKDDGKGIDLDNIRTKVVERKMVAKETVHKLSDEELLSFIFLPQFTLKKEVTEISGRGVGLDVVHNFITKFNGKLKVNNKYGQGVDFEFRLPLSMATLRCVILRIEQQLYAIPVNQIEQVLSLEVDKIYYIEGKAAFNSHNKDVYLFNGKDTLGLDGPNEGVPSKVIVLKSEKNYFGFMVNEIINELELVDRPLPQGLGKLRDVRTASALPDGRPILILDVEDLVTHMDKLRLSVNVNELDQQYKNSHIKKSILVVDDSLTIREVQRNMLEAQGYLVDVAVDGADGWNHLRQNTYHLLITDIDMPRLNGWELLEKVKSHPTLSNLPVIVVSYKDNPGDFERGLESGADSYISKGSFQDNTFIQTVSELLGYPSKDESI
tara:strand:+ start:4136 stop:6811 length:2676 start_codon:yes stop_codon:yes gene_type:complete